MGIDCRFSCRTAICTVVIANICGGGAILDAGFGTVVVGGRFVVAT